MPGTTCACLLFIQASLVEGKYCEYQRKSLTLHHQAILLRENMQLNDSDQCLLSEIIERKMGKARTKKQNEVQYRGAFLWKNCLSHIHLL